MVLIVVLGVYSCVKPINNVIDSQKLYLLKKVELASAVTQRDAMKARFEAQKNLDEKLKNTASDTLKPIFKPEYISPDKMSLFGNLLQDVINFAKQDGLKVRSMEFYSDLEGEPLLIGRTIDNPEELLLSEEAKKNKKNNELNIDAASTTSETPPLSQTSKYKGYQVNIGFLGNYKGLRAFVDELENYSYLIKIKKIETFPYEVNPNILIANFAIVLYADASNN